MSTHVAYASFDPGEPEKGIGYALFDQNGGVLVYDQAYSYEDLLRVLTGSFPPANLPIQTCQKFIIEDYRIFSKKAKAHIGSRVPTIQCIGFLKGIATQYKIPVVMQPSNILPLAEKWTQVKMPKDHSQSHRVSALLHGMYYLINTGIIKTELERQMELKSE